MKPLGRLRIEEAMRAPKPNSALLWLEASNDTERELRKVWAERMEGPATTVMLALVNMGDSAANVQQFRALIPSQYDIARESDQELLTLRHELRTFWNEVSRERFHLGATGEIGDNEEVAVALNKWWKRYDLESDGWMIFWATGTIFPTQKNFRGVIARILFEKRRYLAVCPGCGQYFIKRRDDQKYCLSTSCQRRANNLRQQRFQSDKLKKEAKRAQAKRAHNPKKR